MLPQETPQSLRHYSRLMNEHVQETAIRHSTAEMDAILIGIEYEAILTVTDEDNDRFDPEHGAILYHAMRSKYLDMVHRLRLETGKIVKDVLEG